MKKEVSPAIIIDEAAKLFFYNGYNNTSLQEVAQTLNLTRPALYHYFNSKEHIISSILEDVITNTNQYISEIIQMDEPANIKFEKMIKSHILLILNNQIKFGIFFEEQKSLPAHVTKNTKQVIDNYYDLATKWFEDGIKSNHFVDINPNIAVQTILGSCNWAYKWYSPDGALDKQEISELMSKILIEGYKK